MITEIKEIIEYKKLDISEYDDASDLYEALDYDGSIHERIDSAVDIYYYDLRKWSVDNYNFVEDAMEEGLCEGVTDFHKLIQAGQFVELSQTARDAVEVIFDEVQESINQGGF